MKKYSIIAAIIFLPLLAFSQRKTKAIQKYNDVITLHASMHMGNGVGSKECIPVSLPPHTIRWYYAFYVSKVPGKANNAKDAGELLSKVMNLPDAAATIAIDAASKTADAVDCSAFLLCSENDKNLFMGNSPNFNQEETCSLPHCVSSKAVLVDNSRYLSGIQYLGFANNNWRDAVYINVQVVAVVAVPITKNGWSAEQKDRMFTSLKQRIVDMDKPHKLSDTQIDDFAACFIEKITSTYSFQDFSALAEFEKNQALKSLAEGCEKEFSLDLKLD